MIINTIVEYITNKGFYCEKYIGWHRGSFISIRNIKNPVHIIFLENCILYNSWECILLPNDPELFKKIDGLLQNQYNPRTDTWSITTQSN